MNVRSDRVITETPHRNAMAQQGMPPDWKHRHVRQLRGDYGARAARYN
jgi:hypothetical protein